MEKMMPVRDRRANVIMFLLFNLEPGNARDKTSARTSCAPTNAGVLITIAGMPALEARTDAEGRFALADVPGGDRVISATL